MQQLISVVQSGFLALFDVILPEKARAARVRRRSISDFTLCPTPHELLGQEITTIFNYKDRGVSDLVRALKYEHSNHAADILAAALADYLREEIANMRAFSPRPILIVPVPLHTERMRERGFNQIEKVLRRLPPAFQDGNIATLAPHALVRVRATPQQTRLSRGERLKNVAGAFEADKNLVRGTHVILIDDVATTGATLVCAARPLVASGAVVTRIALARA